MIVTLAILRLLRRSLLHDAINKSMSMRLALLSNISLYAQRHMSLRVDNDNIGDKSTYKRC